jgi:hypothetical protein
MVFGGSQQERLSSDGLFTGHEKSSQIRMRSYEDIQTVCCINQFNPISRSPTTARKRLIDDEE